MEEHIQKNLLNLIKNNETLLCLSHNILPSFLSSSPTLLPQIKMIEALLWADVSKNHGHLLLYLPI